LNFSGAAIPIDYAVIKRSNEIQLFYYPSGGVTADANIKLASGRSINSFALCYGLNNTPVNQSPVASFTANCSQRTCQFDASGSTDAEGGPLTYDWDFGDGSTASGAEVSYTFSGMGNTFDVLLTIKDLLGGGESTALQTITLADPVPPTLPTCSLINNDGYAGDETSGIDSTIVTCPENQATLVCNFEWTQSTDPTSPEQNFGLNNTGTCCWCNPENVDGGAITGEVCFPAEPYDANDPDTLGCPPIDVKEFNQILLLKNGGRVCYVRDGRTVCYR
jgi:PKD repeat protein